MRVVLIEDLETFDGWDGDVVGVKTPTETFQIRRISGSKKRHYFHVWHAFAWKQHPLTLTQWYPCGSLASAIQLMTRHS